MYKLGIDLGGTNIVAGVVDEDYKIIGKGKMKTGATRPAEEIADDMAKAVFMAIEDAGVSIDDIDSMGIGSPGAIDPVNGVVTYANNLGFNNVHLVEMMKERVGKDFYIENDANAAAYGEFLAGAGKGTNNFVAITLGTGVGGGIIIDGKIYSGSNYAGGELGHTVISMNGEMCTCGRHGCWEAYSSATGLINMTKEKIDECKASGRATIMTEMVKKDGKVSGKTAFAAMKQGDAAGAEVVDEYISYLACGLSNMINIFMPEILVIGGGICNEGDNLLVPLNKSIAGETYGARTEKVTKIKTAELGNDAGIIGVYGIGVNLDRAATALPATQIRLQK